jgi:ubiquitin-activating enzyme E1 C
MPKDETVNLCTIAAVPRTPAHCVLWVMLLDKPGTWAHAHKDRKWDTDCYEDMNELYELSLARAQEFNIQGVTYE